MKKTLSILAATLAIAASANAQVHVVAVDGWAVDNAQVDHWFGSNWDGFSLSFKPTPMGGGTVWGWWGWGGTEYWISDTRRCDFVVLEFDGGNNRSGTPVYAERWLSSNWVTWTASAPSLGVAWAAFRVNVVGGIPSVALVAQGSGDAPWQPSWYEQFLPAL